MPIPFESLLPFGIMGVMFGITGIGLSKLRTAQNGGKRHRYCVGRWDEAMMRRDRRLTGFLRGQMDHVEAPPGFEINNPWPIEIVG